MGPCFQLSVLMHYMIFQLCKCTFAMLWAPWFARACISPNVRKIGFENVPDTIGFIFNYRKMQRSLFMDLKRNREVFVTKDCLIATSIQSILKLLYLLFLCLFSYIWTHAQSRVSVLFWNCVSMSGVYSLILQVKNSFFYNLKFPLTYGAFFGIEILTRWLFFPVHKIRLGMPVWGREVSYQSK